MADNKTTLELEIVSKLNNFDTNMSAMSKRMEGVENQVKKTRDGFEKWTKIAVGLGTVLAGGKMLMGFIEKSNEAEAIAAKFAEQLRNAGDGTAKTRDELTDYANQLQDTTVVEGDAIVGAMQLASSLGVQTKDLKSAANGAVGLSRALGVDLNSATSLVSKAYAGNFTALGKLIPEIKNAGTASEKMAILQQKIADGMRVANAEANTGAGQMAILANKWEDLQEGIGDATKRLLVGFGPALKGIIDTAANMIEDISWRAQSAAEKRQQKVEQDAVIMQEVQANVVKKYGLKNVQMLDELAALSFDNFVKRAKTGTREELRAAYSELRSARTEIFNKNYQEGANLRAAIDKAAAEAKKRAEEAAAAAENARRAQAAEDARKAREKEIAQWVNSMNKEGGILAAFDNKMNEMRAERFERAQTRITARQKQVVSGVKDFDVFSIGLGNINNTLEMVYKNMQRVTDEQAWEKWGSTVQGIGAAIGGAFVGGEDGMKSALKSMLNMMIQFAEAQLLVAGAVTIFKSIFGDVGGWVMLAAGIVALETARAAVNSFAKGTDFVPRDQLAFIHRGERIIPASQNRDMMENGIEGTRKVGMKKSNLRGKLDVSFSRFGAGMDGYNTRLSYGVA